MPLYEYECDVCRERFEVIRKFSDPPLETCRSCGKGPVTKLVSSPAIQFKGEGWYVTDYAGKGKPDATSAEKRSSKSDDQAAGGKKNRATSESAATSDSGAKKESSTPAKTDSAARKT